MDQLHQCMKTTMESKISLFLPKAKKEAFDRVVPLLDLYKETNWVGDSDIFIEAGEQFINNLEPAHLLDRRFINEDSVQDHPLNLTWMDTPTRRVMEPLPPILPLSPVKDKSPKPTRKRSRKAKKMEGEL